MKWASGEGMTLFREPTDNANGLTWDQQSRLVACEGVTRRISRLEADGNITVVSGRYDGKRLNRPHDVVVKSDGSIYFTDPGWNSQDRELDISGVYRVSPDLSSITLLVDDCLLPNGLAFSPDESVLYINDSVGMSAQPDDLFRYELRGERSGIPDGMKLDVEGNLYCTGPGGVWVFDASGRHLGTILTGADQTTNCAWGGQDWKTLYITTMEGLLSIRLNIAGMPVPS